MPKLFKAEARPENAGSRIRSEVLTMSIATALVGCAATTTSADDVQAASAHEDVFMLRSLRVERIPKSTWCTPDRAGFGQFIFEDRFTMWSVGVRPRDGRVDNAKAGEAGSLQTCFGLTADPKVVNFYAEGQTAGLSLVGNDECQLVRADFPEKGIATYRCYLALHGLPSPYVCGLLTTSSLVSGAVISGESDPPGYVQTSIATIRLWKAH